LLQEFSQAGSCAITGLGANPTDQLESAELSILAVTSTIGITRS